MFVKLYKKDDTLSNIKKQWEQNNERHQRWRENNKRHNYFRPIKMNILKTIHISIYILLSPTFSFSSKSTLDQENLNFPQFIHLFSRSISRWLSFVISPRVSENRVEICWHIIMVFELNLFIVIYAKADRKF